MWKSVTDGSAVGGADGTLVAGRDLLTDIITAARSKHGRSRRVSKRHRARGPGGLGRDPSADQRTQRVRFHRSAARIEGLFPKAVERAKAALSAAGVDSPHLDAHCWHSNWHTLASRLGASRAGASPCRRGPPGALSCYGSSPKLARPFHATGWCTLSARAPVAQLDRASDFESEGRRFDPCRAHQQSQ